MRLKNVLVLYKQSAYELDFGKSKEALLRKRGVLKEVKRFSQAHKVHYQTLDRVQEVLRNHGVKYHRSQRGRALDYSCYELIITVGGDGTFLEAARNSKKQILLGVNSNPKWSVGRFCCTSGECFQKDFSRFLNKKYQILSLPRIQLDIAGKKSKVQVLNDVLISHRNPAAMSHYSLRIHGIEEEQRSSGVWISTAAGSSGAIQSAGGRLLDQFCRNIQYLPREIHKRPGVSLRLRGGILGPRSRIVIASLMKDGMIYVDGAHHRLEFPFGVTAKVSSSVHPLKVIKM